MAVQLVFKFVKKVYTSVMHTQTSDHQFVAKIIRINIRDIAISCMAIFVCKIIIRFGRIIICCLIYCIVYYDIIVVIITIIRYMVAEWYGAGLATGSNPTNGCCVPTPTLRAIPLGSVNEYQPKLGSKQAYHAMH